MNMVGGVGEDILNQLGVTSLYLISSKIYLQGKTSKIYLHHSLDDLLSVFSFWQIWYGMVWYGVSLISFWLLEECFGVAPVQADGRDGRGD